MLEFERSQDDDNIWVNEILKKYISCKKLFVPTIVKVYQTLFPRENI